jgi:hypothetical protein
MIIYPPEIEIKHSEVTLSARVEMDSPISGLPDRLWFTFPEDYAAHLSGSSNALAASLLLTAMYFDEDLEVRGKLSSRLLYGLQEYQQVYHAWFPQTFHLIKIHYEHLETEGATDCAGKVCTAFSGGVDSLYNVWANLPQNQPIPPHQITHGLFIHGFDIRLYEKEDYADLHQQYQRLFQRLGLELVPARTNGFLFWEFRVDWNYVHGGLLLGTALCLEKLFSTFYVPSTHIYTDLKPLATSPYLDHLLSTERMAIIHFGAHINRIDKLRILSKWSESYDNLRVCTVIGKRHGVNNCSHCNKCLRTMFMLEILGTLTRFTTFRHNFRYRDLFYWIFFSRTSHTYPKIVAKAAFEAGRWDIALPVLIAIPIGYWNLWSYYFLLKISPSGLTYRLKRRFFSRYAEQLPPDPSS